MDTPAQPATIAGIFSIFFRIGVLSFGGGVSGWVFREVVQTRGWLSEAEFLSGLTVSQILPGTNISNLSIYIGHRLQGLRGAVAALLGLLSGPFLAVIALASVFALIKTLPFAEDGLDGVAAAAIGLSFIVAARGVRSAARRPEALAAFAAVFSGVALMHWSLLAVVAVVGPLSVLAAWFRVGADA